VLEKKAAANRQALVVRDSRLEKLTSALSNQARSKMASIGENAGLLLGDTGVSASSPSRMCRADKGSGGTNGATEKELLGQPSFDQTDQKAA